MLRCRKEGKAEPVCQWHGEKEQKPVQCNIQLVEQLLILADHCQTTPFLSWRLETIVHLSFQLTNLIKKQSKRKQNAKSAWL